MRERLTPCPAAWACGRRPSGARADLRDRPRRPPTAGSRDAPGPRRPSPATAPPAPDSPNAGTKPPPRPAPGWPPPARPPRAAPAARAARRRGDPPRRPRTIRNRRHHRQRHPQPVLVLLRRLTPRRGLAPLVAMIGELLLQQQGQPQRLHDDGNAPAIVDAGLRRLHRLGADGLDDLHMDLRRPGEQAQMPRRPLLLGSGRGFRFQIGLRLVHRTYDEQDRRPIQENNVFTTGWCAEGLKLRPSRRRCPDYAAGRVIGSSGAASASAATANSQSRKARTSGRLRALGGATK